MSDLITMECKPRVMPPRRKYWKERQAISAASRFTTAACSDTSAGQVSADVTIDQLNAAVAGLEKCTNCSNSDARKFRQVLVDRDESLLYLECLSCHTLNGQDDMTSPEEARDWLRSLKVDLCSCGNTDAERFIFGERDGTVFLTCQCCMKEIPMSANGAVSRGDDECRLQCRCGNDSDELFSIFSVNDSFLAIQCLQCDMYAYTQYLDDYPEVDDVEREDLPPSPVSIKEAQQACIRGRVRVEDISQLSEGDHIAWWRPEQYWHHALATGTDAATNKVTVIHYNGPSPGGLRHGIIKGKVVEEELDMASQSGIPYKMLYRGQCLSAAEAIERATTRLGETTYNFFTNNCEHFVRWCKTGSSICEQVTNAVKAGLHHGKNMGGYISSYVLKKALKKLVLRSGVGTQVGSLATDVATVTYQHVGKLGAVVYIGLEVCTALWDINQTRQQRAEGDISRREFTSVVVRRSSQCVLRGGGAIIGGGVGSVLLPWLGTYIGSSLGAFLGHYAGSFIGYAHAKYDCKLTR